MQQTRLPSRSQRLDGADPTSSSLRRRPRFVPDHSHPGFHDLDYRARRDAIADLAWDCLEAKEEAAFELEASGRPPASSPLPLVDYSSQEHALWRDLFGRLRGLAKLRAAAELVDAANHINLDTLWVPQLREVSRVLEARSGIRMEPVPGLVEVAPFFAALAEGVFLATQYLRHPSRPDYTPEPDLVHELVGHAATLSIPRVATLHRRLGEVSRGADSKRIVELEKLYWFTFEFGVIRQANGYRALGAGLLSSAHELVHFEREAELLPWSVEHIMATEYDNTRPQTRLFYAYSFDALLDGFEAALA